MKAQAIRERLGELNGNAVLLEGLDDALVGIAQQFGGDHVACYDYEKMVQVLIDRDGMDREGAIEFLEFNTINVHYQDGGNPVFIYEGR